jgi:hypothetical protein
VQVGDTVHAPVGREHRREVHQLPAVAPHLLGGVEHWLLAVARDAHQLVANRLCVRPLLELYQDIRRLPGPRVHTAEQGIDALRAVGQPVLQQDLDVVQAGVMQVVQESREAVAPRVDLTDARAGVEPDAGLLGEELVQPVGLGLPQQYIGTVTNQGHSDFPHEACAIGMRVGATTSRRLGARRAAPGTLWDEVRCQVSAVRPRAAWHRAC